MSARTWQRRASVAAASRARTVSLRLSEEAHAAKDDESDSSSSSQPDDEDEGAAVKPSPPDAQSRGLG